MENSLTLIGVARDPRCVGPPDPVVVLFEVANTTIATKTTASPAQNAKMHRISPYNTKLDLSQSASLNDRSGEQVYPIRCAFLVLQLARVPFGPLPHGRVTVT